MNTTTMTEQEINIMIAKLCGWTMIHIETELNPDKDRRTYLAGKSPLVISDCDIEDYFKMEVPHYATDLNAMHQAEKILTSEQGNEYLQTLAEIAVPIEKLFPKNRAYFMDGTSLHATARQRAEAFIATLAK